VQFPHAATAITTPQTRILRLPEVIARVGLKRASIYQHIATGSFPKQISLGIRAVGWLESEIDQWLAVRISARQIQKT
jgi:prophage regulatory protein